VPGSLVGVAKERATMTLNQAHARRGLGVSYASIVWTVLASSIEIVEGFQHHVLTLVVFGLAGSLDAIGSAALVVHFRHALRHDELADHHERRATIIVSVGLVVLGVVTVVESARRLASGHEGTSSTVGVVIAAAAIFVLGALSLVKQRVGRELDSAALVGDGYLSASGALLAAVAVVGATIGTREGLWWVDPLAALVIALGAASLGVVFLRRGLRD
jgi:divalent metal cation (Fe/Co/Zn/Cd) transporter